MCTGPDTRLPRDTLDYEVVVGDEIVPKLSPLISSNDLVDITSAAFRSPRSLIVLVGEH